MNSIKRLFIYVLIVLFLVSIHKDLTVGTPMDSEPEMQNGTKTFKQESLTAVEVKVNEGDTVLTIVEELNDQNDKQLDIPQIQADFEALNPNVQALHVEPGEYYYFPLY
ncbi:hypothetical protein GCM10007063_02130 [Lentibacillus kapialis]|uniref:LysM domain-containing protein n=1 Tax=Lentibacillus kapialis TaxID=340214 RepID=A0A917PKR5_9BACI|nr:hypothetical protein [Lentibacillus kapialis]GGJ83191.1 hypothetical protein GCM10007063_02130 [Lentibacillus kapialis]